MTSVSADTATNPLLQGWTAPPFPPARVLEGRYCRLEPVDPARHLDDIWAVNSGNDHIWQWMPAHPPQTREAYGELLAMMAAKPGIVPFAIIDKADGKAKGHLWLMEIRPEHGVFEVGYITYSPILQRTRVASEAIYLCGAYGFSLGYRRFEWKCNNLNEPSKRAALRFGFQFEGLFRQHQVVKGRNRDTAWFSILDSEWPARAQGFRRWLAPENFDASGCQKRSLGVFIQAASLAGTVPLRRATMADIPALEALKTAAYLPNEAISGVPSLPRMADYAKVVAEHEIWLVDGAAGPTGPLEAALVLDIEPETFTVWSIAVSPQAAGRKLGRALMDYAEARARELGYDAVLLYTHSRLADRIAWYERLGFRFSHHEEMADRQLTHLRKSLSENS
jgi:RimJ/RimL family protein N-acetyltransferase/ribosomal protein S18 acetylase RimI-like enzyme